MEHTEVAIAGGGIIGLSLALELAAAGRQVTVFERGRAMSEASWAAAGMLAAADPENPPPLQPLSDLSRALYPQFLEDVSRLSNISIPIRTTQAVQGAAHLPQGFEEIDQTALNALAPAIEGGGLKFFLLDEWSLNPRDLVRALPQAVRAAGVTLLEDTPVLDVHSGPQNVRLTTPEGSWTADIVVHATGAWAADLAGIPAGPRKGQMIEVRDPGPRPLGVVLRTPQIYLVPRGNGHIVIGATVENAGFDKQVEPAAIAALLETAAALWPPIRGAEVLDAWAGLRPACGDDLPILDRLDGHTWIAAGHFRNGILLAPGTARLLREMILGQPLSIDTSPFRCGRFAVSSVQ